MFSIIKSCHVTSTPYAASGTALKSKKSTVTEMDGHCGFFMIADVVGAFSRLLCYVKLRY